MTAAMVLTASRARLSSASSICNWAGAGFGCRSTAFLASASATPLAMASSRAAPGCRVLGSTWAGTFRTSTLPFHMGSERMGFMRPA